MNPAMLSQPPTSTYTKPKRTVLKIFVVIILLLALSILGFFLYLKWQLKKQVSQNRSTINPTLSTVATPDASVAWNTYTNNKYKFTFSYPSNWVIRGIAGSQILPEDADSFFLEKQDYSIQITVSKTEKISSSSSTFRSLVRNNGRYFVEFKLVSTKIPPQDISNVPALDHILNTLNFKD